MLKNLRKNKNYLTELQKKYGQKISESENYSPTEWTEIKKIIGEEVSVSENDRKISSNNSPLQNKLIIVGAVASLIILVVGGFTLIKKRKKKE